MCESVCVCVCVCVRACVCVCVCMRERVRVRVRVRERERESYIVLLKCADCNTVTYRATMSTMMWEASMYLDVMDPDPLFHCQMGHPVLLYSMVVVTEMAPVYGNLRQNRKPTSSSRCSKESKSFNSSCLLVELLACYLD